MGDDGGTVLALRVNQAPRLKESGRGGSYRPAWNRFGGARGRHRVSEDGTGSVKAPPAVATMTTKRGEFASMVS